MALWREVEACRRRFAPLDHALIGEVQSRNLAHAFGARSITVLASDVLRISAGEASGRVKAAEALGRRRSFVREDGLALPPARRRPVLDPAAVARSHPNPHPQPNPRPTIRLTARSSYASDHGRLRGDVSAGPLPCSAGIPSVRVRAGRG
ncbi:MAG: DUF222 domain-containing protein, partial [Jatrophihabitantaceae bacterium]